MFREPDLAILKRTLLTDLLSPKQVAAILTEFDARGPLVAWLVARGILPAGTCRELEAATAEATTTGAAPAPPLDETTQPSLGSNDENEGRTWDLPGKDSPLLEDAEAKTLPSNADRSGPADSADADATVDLSENAPPDPPSQDRQRLEELSLSEESTEAGTSAAPHESSSVTAIFEDGTGTGIAEASQAAPTIDSVAGMPSDGAEATFQPAAEVGPTAWRPEVNAEARDPGSTVAAAGPSPVGFGPEKDRTARETSSSGGGIRFDSPLLKGKKRYLVDRELARGGLGRVLLGRDQYLERDVAIKELLPSARPAPETVGRFLEEAQVTGQLQHPGIVPIYELGLKEDGQPFYSMKLLSGRTYSRAIKDYHALAPEDPKRTMAFAELLRIFVDVCDTLAYAHSRGVVHRDLKPANIMLGDFGEAVVLDWGIAKVLGPEGGAEGSDDDPSSEEEPNEPGGSTIRTTYRDDASRTQAGRIMGTPAYMAPEQAAGDPQADPRTDIYALGIILHEILVGKPPFTGRQVTKVLDQVKRGNIVPPRQVRAGVPPALSAVTMKATAFRREDRYRSVRDLGEDVKRYLAGEPVGVYPPRWWERAWRWVKRHRTATTSAAVALCLLTLSLGVWSWWEGRRLERVRQESRRLIRSGQEALLQNDFDRAEQQLETALALARQEEALEDLAVDANQLLVETRTREESATRKERTRRTYARFLQRREDALYHGTLFTGLDTANNLLKCAQAAREALDLAEKLLDPKAADVALGVLEEHERRRVSPARKELTLLLAEAQAMPLPDDSPEEKTAKCRTALATLAGAADTEPVLRSYHFRMAKYLKELATGQKGDERETTLRRAEAQQRLGDQVIPSAAADFFFLGDESFRQGDYRRALLQFDESLRREPDRFWSQYFVAACYLRENQPAQALGYLTACATRRPDFSWAYLLRGTAYGQLDQFAAAEADFTRAEELGVVSYALHINRGAMRLRQGKTAQAGEDLLKARDLQPNRYEGHFNLAKVRFEEKRWNEALDHLNAAIAKAPHLASPYRLRAQVLLRRNDPEGALKDLDNALKFETPGSKAPGEDHYERGRILHQQKRYQEALQAYDASLKQQPERAETQRLRAETLLALGKNQEALKALDEFLNRPKDADPDAYRLRGFERARTGNSEGALADWTRALEMDPASALTRGRRGWAFLNHADQLALADFEAALKLEPNSADLHTGRGYARVQTGRHAEAVEDAETAVKLATRSEDPRERIAVPLNAACIYAQAFGKVTFAGEGPGRKDLQARYLARALELLDRSIGLLPPQARPGFVRQIRNDPGLEPIRNLAPFRNLMKDRGGN